MQHPSQAFTRYSAELLRDTYLQRLRQALERLPPGDLWWRPGEDTLAFGTVLLHLNGNLHEWILGGVGGVPFERDRDAEFAATDGPAGIELFGRLERTVRECTGVIEALGEERLAEEVTIQGRTTTVLEAVYHVVEHFAWHAGQAAWISKARASSA